MAKAYWLSIYRSISDPEALAAYAKLAGPAVEAAGGRFLVRGVAAAVYEAGLEQRSAIVEFDSLAAAIAARESAAYQEALQAFGNAAERDFRIVEGV
ncbi:MAG TPA: DUF1330 domain-containing protein [Paraburkholderia sp.]|jgi:uncharacterized protein (DUF1330 family)|nr:DUF1330 domain-containing protein [Paraburkholderia sp.]